MSGTVEISQQQQEDAEFQAQRHEEIAAICWRRCEDCNGRGYHRTYWVDDESGGCDYVLKPTCENCEGGHIQLHDPWRVEALYDAADDAREELGVWCFTRIASALALAINGNVYKGGPCTVASATEDGKLYLIAPFCNCLDAFHRAPMINDKPACKHQIAVWLVKAAERKMYDQEPKHYGPWSDALDGLISVKEAQRREVSK